ncbi:hypothetical protein BM1_02352 [Bipolaris maydis]|nr:hypothetical protein BM1_02352 [Bipolaris maydis]KAJ5028215.1 hypothetical protein J3E73DRAFT_368641 [Bipolaris maydis]
MHFTKVAVILIAIASIAFAARINGKAVTAQVRHETTESGQYPVDDYNEKRYSITYIGIDPRDNRTPEPDNP